MVIVIVILRGKIDLKILIVFMVDRFIMKLENILRVM